MGAESWRQVAAAREAGRVGGGGDLGGGGRVWVEGGPRMRESRPGAFSANLRAGRGALSAFAVSSGREICATERPPSKSDFGHVTTHEVRLRFFSEKKAKSQPSSGKLNKRGVRALP